MSLADRVGGLLRTITLPVSGEGDHPAGASGIGISGADFFTAELELQPWSAAATASSSSPSSRNPATSPTNSISITEQSIHDAEIPLPEFHEPTVTRIKKEETASKAGRTESISSVVSASTQNTSRTNTGPSKKQKDYTPNDVAINPQAVQKKQQASEVCWREYWG
ncbi:hypothetical protein M426DRAFT_8724 [Hypoxylon sp. CI-4A]|nr:hypothetical protein M426DRAFT_8724 [Hypoxylon sp. CI-4A]